MLERLEDRCVPALIDVSMTLFVNVVNNSDYTLTFQSKQVDSDGPAPNLPATIAPGATAQWSVSADFQSDNPFDTLIKQIGGEATYGVQGTDLGATFRYDEFGEGDINGNSFQNVFLPKAVPNILNIGDPTVSQSTSGFDFATATFTVTTAFHGTANPDPGAFSPQDIRQAYGFNSVGSTGSGQTIAIIDASNNPNIFTSVDAFDQQTFSTPAAQTAGSPTLFQQFGAASTFLRVFNQDGVDITSQIANSGMGPVPSFDVSGRNQDEQDLDVEWAHSIAPGAQIDLVEANSLNNSDLIQAIANAEKLPNVSVISMSYGGAEGKGDVPDATVDSDVFQPNANNAGITFVASSGDTGAPPENPSSSPEVLAVGGTALTLNTGTITNEVGWSGSGGGLSSEFTTTEAPYQKGLVISNGSATVNANGMRSTPDVAFNAVDFNEANADIGPAVPWEPGPTDNGTSFAAPCWAGLIADANQLRKANGLPTLNGFKDTLPTLYGLLGTGDFRDITSGTSKGTPNYSAGTGYDLVTGIGVPVANLLIPDLGNTTADLVDNVPVAVADHDIVLKQDGANLDILDNGMLATSHPINKTSRVDISAGDAAGNITLTIDLSGQFSLPIFFDGGTGSGTHTLVLSGDPFTNEVETPTGATSGTIVFDANPAITYTNVDTVDDTTAISGAATFNGTSAAERINIVDGGKVNGARATQISSGSATFATVNFANKPKVTVDGQGGGDSFFLNNPNPAAGLTGTLLIDGGGDTATLNGPNQALTWNITAQDVGNLVGLPDSVAYQHVQNLTGGSGNDKFVFSDGAAESGTVDGGDTASVNTLDYHLYATAISINLQTGAATGTGGFANIQNLVGSAGKTTLTGTNAVNTWNITAPGAGNVNGSFTFSAVSNLIGGSMADDFVIGAGGSLTGTLSGGLGTDTLDETAVANSAVTIQGKGTDDGVKGTATGLGGFDDINKLQGFTTLVAPDADNVWDVTGLNTGTLSTLGVSISYIHLPNLRGGSKTDRFIIHAGGSEATVDGNGGSNTLDYSDPSQTGPVSVQLTGVDAKDGFAGNATSLSGGFHNIDTLIGSASTSDTLTGINADATWTVNTGTSTYRSGSGTLSFSSFETLHGGSGVDTFNVYASSSLFTLDGGDGGDQYNLFGNADVVNITDTGTTGIDAAFLNGLGSSVTFTITPTQTTYNKNTVNYDANLEQLTAFATSGSDTFEVTPSAATTFFVTGYQPGFSPLPGDTLDVHLDGTTNATRHALTASADGYSGLWTFDDRMPVNFSGIDTLLPRFSASGPGTSFSPTQFTLTDDILLATLTSNFVVPAQELQATVQWGDQQVSPGYISLVGRTYEVRGGHTYLAAGSYAVTVSVVDTIPAIGGGSATASAAVQPDAVASTPAVVAEALEATTNAPASPFLINYWTYMFGLSYLDYFQFYAGLGFDFDTSVVLAYQAAEMFVSASIATGGFPI